MTLLHKLIYSWYWTKSTFSISVSLTNTIRHHDKRFSKEPRNIYLCPNCKWNFICLAATFIQEGVPSHMWGPSVCFFIIKLSALHAVTFIGEYFKIWLVFLVLLRMYSNKDCKHLLIFQSWCIWKSMFERVKFPKNTVGYVNFFDLENKEFLSMIKYFCFDL